MNHSFFLSIFVILALFSFEAKATAVPDENEKPNYLSPLPPELHYKIADYLDIPSRQALASTNKAMRAVVRDPWELEKRSQQERFAFYITDRMDLSSFIDSHKDYITRDICVYITDKSLTDEDLKGLSDVKNITLFSCPKITGAGLEHLTSATTVGLYCCSLIRDAGLENLKNVTTVDLSSCPLITDAGLENLKNAMTVDLSRCKITDNGLSSLTNATTVGLGGCFLITDAGLAYLENATTVGLEGCFFITDAGLAHLTNVTTVDISFCPLITDAAKQALRDKGVRVID